MVLNIDIPAAWERSAATIMQHKWRKVLILGAVDRGKSTYSAFLSQRLLAAGEHVAVVDADIGQKDIGPPATITLGYPVLSAALSDVPPAAFYFVGAVSPVGRLLPMLVGTKRLVDVARAPHVIINTTGFIEGAGQALKSYKIEALQPDVIVVLTRGTELAALIRAYRNYQVIRIRPSPHATAKTPLQRQAARERRFCRYFECAATVTLPCERLIFQRLETPAALQPHLLCGLADRRARGLGLALVVAMDGDTISLHTPVLAERIRIVQGGDLYVSPDGRELGHR